TSVTGNGPAYGLGNRQHPALLQQLCESHIHNFLSEIDLRHWRRLYRQSRVSEKRAGVHIHKPESLLAVRLNSEKRHHLQPATAAATALLAIASLISV